MIPNETLSRDEYLQGELTSEIRHEYVAGRVYAMSGGTLNHQRVAGNFFHLAKSGLTGKPCFPTGSDFKLFVPLGRGEEAFYYPQVPNPGFPAETGTSETAGTPLIYRSKGLPGMARLKTISRHADSVCPAHPARPCPTNPSNPSTSPRNSPNRSWNTRCR